MCFSPEVSFTAAGMISVIGYQTVKITSSRSLIFLALIPFLFALQQFSEGILWLNLGQSAHLNPIGMAARYIFLFFAFVFWPVWLPLSLYQAEEIAWRKKILALSLLGGIFLSGYNLINSLHHDLFVAIVGHSIQYNADFNSPKDLYALVIILSTFLSSLKNMWLFGILIVLSLLFTHLFFTETFASVWCFFSALASLSLYKIIKDNKIDEKVEEKVKRSSF